MNKRQKKKLFGRCNIWHYAEFKNTVQHLPKNVRKFFRMFVNANYKLMHTKLPKNIYKENLETTASTALNCYKMSFEPILFNKYDISEEFVKYKETPEQVVHKINPPTVHKTFGEDNYSWLLDVINNATCFNDPIEEVIDYIDRLLTDCGYDVIQVYQHILDKDEFVDIYPSENAEVCLKAMGQSVARIIYDFTKEFKDIARAAMAFHPELVDNKKV